MRACNAVWDHRKGRWASYRLQYQAARRRCAQMNEDPSALIPVYRIGPTAETSYVWRYEVRLVRPQDHPSPPPVAYRF